nr:formate dehydrogenase formation protein FdhE [uncultured bacterium]
MQGTATGLRADPATRLTDLEQQRPEWRVWINLLNEASRALEKEQWQVTVTERSGEGSGPDPAPLLQGCTIEVHGGRVRRLAEVLVQAMHGERPDAGHSISESSAIGLVQAAMSQDPTAFSALAWELCVDDQALTSVAHLAALPLLQACGRLLSDQVPAHWPHGFCPVCAAWPILAERRGLDRGRYLRCGRCSAEWEVEWLRCVYCGEREHERLGSLIPEDTGELLKIETCGSCQGYLKSVATLQGIPPFELLIQDLETVELDLVALDRGYQRPAQRKISLRVVSRES